MRQVFRFSGHMMPSKCPTKAVGLCVSKQLFFLSWDRCWATVNALRPVKLLKVQNFYKFKMTIKIKKSSRALRLEGDDLRKRWWWWEALSQLPVSKLQLPSNPALIPPPRHPPPTTPISQSEILSELIPGNVYFEEQIVALLLTQCVSLLIGRGPLTPCYLLCRSESTMCLSCCLSYSEMSRVNVEYMSLTSAHKQKSTAMLWEALSREQCFKLNANICIRCSE